LLITKVLAHEVAHHLRFTRGHIFLREERFKRDWQEEAAADGYAFDVIRRMRKRWSYWLGHEIIDIAAQVDYSLGVKSWKQKDYVKAASYWDKAMRLNSEHTYAAHWHGRAVAMLRSNRSEAGGRVKSVGVREVLDAPRASEDNS